MEFMNGKMDGAIKEISKMTLEMGTENCLMGESAFIRDTGLMENKLNKMMQSLGNKPDLLQAYKLVDLMP